MMSCLFQNQNDWNSKPNSKPYFVLYGNGRYLVNLLVGNNMQNHSIPTFAQGYLDFLYGSLICFFLWQKQTFYLHVACLKLRKLI